MKVKDLKPYLQGDVIITETGTFLEYDIDDVLERDVEHIEGWTVMGTFKGKWIDEAVAIFIKD